MKQILLINVLFFCYLFSSAQNSWKLRLNDTTLLVASKEDEKTNSKKINVSEWEKNGMLEITYYNATGDKDLKRSILFLDENDNELIRKEDVSRVKISSKELKKIFTGRNEIRIFTIAIPADPELAARVRVRRVHLCTLELK
jgi:hypothetical protein